MLSAITTALSRQPPTSVLRSITDPRDRRGVRHDLPTVLSLAVTGVLAGCRSLTAIWEHTTDLTATDLETLGPAADQALPSAVIHPPSPAGPGPRRRRRPPEVMVCIRTGTINARRVIAVDGKTMRGARRGQVSVPHLLAALDHATGAVLTQQRVAGKSNEIPALRELLEPLDLDEAVVTADAMHTQVDTAQWITRRGGHTFSRLWATRRLCTVLSRPCPGRTSHPSQASTPDTGGGCDAPSRPSRPPPGWTSPQPPRCSSHQTTHPNPHLNQLCRPPDLRSRSIRRQGWGAAARRPCVTRLCRSCPGERGVIPIPVPERGPKVGPWLIVNATSSGSCSPRSSWRTRVNRSGCNEAGGREGPPEAYDSDRCRRLHAVGDVGLRVAESGECPGSPSD